LDGLDLRALKLVFVGAEPVWANTLDRFANTFGPCGFNPRLWYPCYGLAEATLIVTGCERNTPPITRLVSRAAIERNAVDFVHEPTPDALTLVGCGHAPEGLDVRIVDPDTRAVCPPDKVGEIWVAGPTVARGYWNNPEATEVTFRARLARTNEGPFLRTGDLGFFREGLLYIAGRLKDLVIINGRNHHPHDIEATAMHAHPLIRPGGCAAFSVADEPEERLAIVIEVRRDAFPAKSTDCGPDGRAGNFPTAPNPVGELGAVVDAVRRAVGKGHDLLVHRVAVVGSGSIPRTSSGKTQRRKCREGYLNGSLGVIFEG
jgi:acyl-CoA synthetase (AMP-forming)/AMP-acid ligase II